MPEVGERVCGKIVIPSSSGVRDADQATCAHDSSAKTCILPGLQAALLPWRSAPQVAPFSPLAPEEVSEALDIAQGLAMQRFLHLIADSEGPQAVDFEFVLVAGHFLMRDENLFTFFEGLSLKPPESAHGAWTLPESL